MKTTGTADQFDKIDNKPERPFLKDLKRDLGVIDLHYSKKASKEIKLKMIDIILKDI